MSETHAVRIRPLAQEAGPEWSALMNSGLQNCPGFEPVVELDFEQLWSGDRAMMGLTLGAQGEADLIGAISVIFGHKRGQLRDLVVRSDGRRRGVGTALVGAALERLRERGLELAEAQDWDVPSYRAFFVAQGFRPVRRYLLLCWDLTRAPPALPVNRDVNVRPATMVDLEDVANLYARMYRPYWDWSREGTLEEIRERYRTRFARRLGARESGRVYLVAVLEDRLVGGITAQVDRACSQARGLARGLLNPGGVGVLPAYRRQGIASRLVTEALALLRERGMQEATVWTFSYLESETPAVSLYRRTGARMMRRSLGWEKEL
jgi:ribosomal protein S18 acetylase RimI-like enzyme